MLLLSTPLLQVQCMRVLLTTHAAFILYGPLNVIIKHLFYLCLVNIFATVNLQKKEEVDRVFFIIHQARLWSEC